MSSSIKETLNKMVVVSIVANEDKILMVERKKAEDRLSWQFPAGQVEINETEESAVERETYEESNIKCKSINKIGERIHPDTNRIMSYWLCEYISGQPKVNDTAEVKSARWMNIDEAFSVIKTNLYPPVQDYLLNIKKKYENLRDR